MFLKVLECSWNFLNSNLFFQNILDFFEVVYTNKQNKQNMQAIKQKRQKQQQQKRKQLNQQ